MQDKGTHLTRGNDERVSILEQQKTADERCPHQVLLGGSARHAPPRKKAAAILGYMYKQARSIPTTVTPRTEGGKDDNQSCCDACWWWCLE